jgi:hypothetical protein
MGMLYELDKIEKDALLRGVVQRVMDDLNDGKPLVRGKYTNDGPLSKMNPRPGEKVQKFYCEECKEFHEGSVLGGAVDPHKQENER